MNDQERPIHPDGSFDMPELEGQVEDTEIINLREYENVSHSLRSAKDTDPKDTEPIEKWYWVIKDREGGKALVDGIGLGDMQTVLNFSPEDNSEVALNEDENDPTKKFVTIKFPYKQVKVQTGDEKEPVKVMPIELILEMRLEQFDQMVEELVKVSPVEVGYQMCRSVDLEAPNRHDELVAARKVKMETGN